MKEKLVNYLKAKFPAVAIRTAEENRALQVLKSIAEDRNLNCYVWTAGVGIRQVHKQKKPKFAYQNVDADTRAVQETTTPGDAARVTDQETTPVMKDGESVNVGYDGILVFCDFHGWVDNLNPFEERAIKELLQVAPKRNIFVVFLGPQFRVPRSFEHHVTVMDFELPTRDELDTILKAIEKGSTIKGAKPVPLDNGERDAVLRAALGLTAPEAENAFALAVIEHDNGKINAKTVYREKAAAVRRSGLMEIIEPDPRGLDAIGGLDNLKAWIVQRKPAYSKAAREYGLPSPRGCLVAGIPGCGKSESAKCIITELNVPGIRLDIGAMFAGIVGESEARIRAALALADAISPCVLFVDEINPSVSLAA